MWHQFMNWWRTTDVMGGMDQMAAWLETSQYVQKIMACMQGFSFPWSLCQIHDKTLHLIRVSLGSSAWKFENMGSGQFGTISVHQRSTKDKKNNTSSLVEETDEKTVHYTRISNAQHANSHLMLSGTQKYFLLKYATNPYFYKVLQNFFNFLWIFYPDLLNEWCLLILDLAQWSSLSKSLCNRCLEVC